MTREEVREVFQLVLAGWPTQRQRLLDADLRAMTAMYTLGLIDLEYKLVQQALGRLVRTSEWMPTVAAIRDAVGVVAHGRKPTGAEAWGEVVAAMKRYGSHRTPGNEFTFNDPIVARVVRMFGWRDLCASDNAHADRARFIDAYDRISMQERVEAQASPGGVSHVLPLRDRSVPIGDAANYVLDEVRHHATSKPRGGS
jgi:hypothetical protein